MLVVMVNTPLLSPGSISPPALWRSLVARGGLCGCAGLWIILPCSLSRAAQPAQKQAKAPSCCQAFLPDVNENQLNQQGIGYVIHFISISIFSLTGKCLFVKKFASAWRSNLSKQTVRCWMKPSSQASTKWNCPRTRGEGRGLWGGISSISTCAVFWFLPASWRGEVFWALFCSSMLSDVIWESWNRDHDLWMTMTPGHSVVAWQELSRPASLARCVLALLLRLGLSWGGGSTLCSVCTHFPQPLSATAKGGGSGKNQPSRVFAIPSLKYWPC